MRVKETNKQLKKSRGFLKYWEDLGPGLTTGAADDDPSGIATYSQAGSKFGFQFLWLALFTFPLMGVVQEMCARLGLVTGRGLASNMRKYFPRWILYGVAAMLFIANTFNLGADLGAMAEASRLLFPKISFGIFVVGYAALILVFQILVPYATYARYLKYLTLVLLAYILAAGFVSLNFREILWYTFIPNIKINFDQIFLVTAVLGTTISPYLFFWQTSQEVEEEILEGKTTLKQRKITTTHDIKKMRIDVWVGMFVSNLVMFFIIVVCGATLFASGIHNVASARQAAEALRPLAGNGAYLLFTIGIIGTGALAVPILAGSASYAISESLGFKEGLFRKFREAQSFYVVIVLAMLVGLLLNFVGLNPIKALIYSAVINGLIAPIILVIIVLLSSKKKLMGEFVNSPIQNFLGWLVVTIMVIAGVATIASFIF